MGEPSKEEFPKNESLKLTIERTLPYWNNVIVPQIKAGKKIIIAAHGNSLRGVVKHLDNMSAAKAASDHMASWFRGTGSEDWVSMGVFSDGSYGTPEGVMFSFPVRIESGRWSIVQGLAMSDYAKEKMTATGKELREERDEALAVCR